MRPSTKLMFFLLYPEAYKMYCRHIDFFTIYERHFNGMSPYSYYIFMKEGSKPLNQKINITPAFDFSDLYIRMAENLSIRNIYDPKIFISLP